MSKLTVNVTKRWTVRIDTISPRAKINYYTNSNNNICLSCDCASRCRTSTILQCRLVLGKAVYELQYSITECHNSFDKIFLEMKTYFRTKFSNRSSIGRSKRKRQQNMSVDLFLVSSMDLVFQNHQINLK